MRGHGLWRIGVVGLVISATLAVGVDAADAYETVGTTTAWTGTTASRTATYPSGLTITAAVSNLRAAGMLTLDPDTLVSSVEATSAMFTPGLPVATQGVGLTAWHNTTLNDCDGEPNGATAGAGTGAGSQQCLNMGQLTLTFSQPVTNPTLHLSGFGGTAPGSNYAENTTQQLNLLSSTPAGASLGAVSAGAVNLQSGTSIRPVDLRAAARCVTISSPALSTSGCGSVQLVGTFTSVTFGVEMNQQVVANDGSGPPPNFGDLIRFTVTVPEDAGDAPATYNGSQAPLHVIGDLKLGSSVDEDMATVANSATGVASANADADDNTLDDEEGVSLFPPLSAAAVGQAYTVPVALSGVSKSARVCAWIDFNRSGVFDNPSERACQTVAAGATSTSLSWTIPTLPTAGLTFVRIRTAYDVAQAESPTGLAASGEVEDYPITISPALFRLAKITNGAVGPFSFTTTNTAASPIALTTTTAGTPITSPAADIMATSVDITATETVPVGWTLVGASCSDTRGAATGNGTGTFGTLAGSTVTVPAANVRVGSDITCTVTNEKTPSISIAKTSVGGSGTFSFATTNTSSTPVSVTTPSAGSTATSSPSTVTNRANPVTITETVPSGWRLTAASCTDRNGTASGNGTATFGSLSTATVTVAAANLRPGADIVCTVTNDRPATLRVTKQAIGGGGPFPFTVTGGASSSFTVNPNPPSIPQVTQTITPVTAAASTKIVENGAASAGFTLVDVTCVDQGGAPTGSTIGTPNLVNTPAEMGNVTVSLVPAADVNCVFTNIKNADIALIKVSRGGDTTVPFTVSYDDGTSLVTPTITTTGGVGTSSFSVRFPTLVTSRLLDIAETVPAGYVLTAVECSATSGSISVVSSNLTAGTARASVTPGTTGSCKFTNDKRPTVTIRKQTTNGTGSFSFSGGTNGLGPSFNLDTTPANPASSSVFTLTAPNTATSITETLPTDWQLTAVTCVDGSGATVSAPGWLVGGTLTIPGASLPGGANLTCTYVNDHLLPLIDVTKTAGTLTGPDGAGNFSISYAIAVTNSGLGSGTYGSLTDTPAPTPGLVFTGSAWTTAGAGAPAGGSAAGSGPFTLAPAATAIAPGVTHTYTLTQTFRYTAAATAATCAGPGSGLYNSVALPAGAETDTANNAACVNAPPRPTPAITTAKALAPGSISSYDALAQRIDYTITVTNTGNLDLNPVVVTDARADTGTLACPATLLAVGASMVCTAQHTITQADLDAGAVRNTASSTGTAADGATVTAPSSEVVVPAVQRPALSAVKSTTTTGISAVGQVIGYSITVGNPGNVTINDIVVTDPQADSGSISCGAVVLAPGQTMTCTATHLVTQADLDVGSVTNVATAGGRSPAGAAVSVDSVGVVVPAVQTPAVTTNKSSPTVDFAAIGDVVTYAITVANTGNVTLTGVAATDPQADAAPVCSPTTLAPGASATCPARHTITQADLDAGSVTNVASGAGTSPGGTTVTDPSDAVVVPARQTPAVTTSKALASGSITSFGAVGEVIAYVITVTNTGNVTLTGPTIADPKADAVPVCPASSIPPATSTTCTATHTVTQADLDAGSVSNTATASASPPSGPAVSDPSDPVVVPAVVSPTLLTEKSSPNPSYSSVGDVISYAIIVTNTGNQSISGIAVSDPVADTAPTCTATALAPGASMSCTASHTVTQADLDRGSLSNVATASGLTPSGATVSDPSDPALVPAVQQRAVVTTKALASTSITEYSAVGDVISYVIVVTNTGNVTLTAVAVSDSRADSTPACSVSVLAPNGSTTCTATHTVTQGDLDAGSVDNVALGVGTPPFGPAISDPSDAVSVPAVAAPALTAVKAVAAGSVTSYGRPGEVIGYQITVANTGNVTLNPVAVSDPVADAGSVVCPQTALSPGASMICTARHTTTQADVDGGSVSNTATASGTPPSGPAVAVTSNPVVVPAVLTPGVRTIKTSTTPSFAAVGAQVLYEISVTNIGNTTLTSVGVADPKADAGSISCSAGTLLPGETATCTAVHTVTQSDLDLGSVSNTATGSGTPPSGPSVSDPSDPVVVAGVASPAVSTVKALAVGGPTSYSAVGEVVEYVVTVTNAGNVTLTGVSVSDALADQAPVCDVATLAPGASATCTAVHTVTQSDLDLGSVSNTATGSGTPPSGPSVSDPSDPVVVAGVASPAVSTVKALAVGGPTSYSAVGEVVEYVVTVTNAGNVTLTGVSVSDALADQAPVCDVATLAPGASATCTAVHTVTQADLDLGSVSNTATGSGTPPNGPSVSDPSDPVVVAAVATPGISAMKSSPNVAVSAVGDVVDYTITVTNTGNVTLTSVAVSDPRADAVPACPLTVLAPGESTTCSATHTVVQADLDTGSVVNLATAQGQPPSGPVVTGPSNQVTIPVIQAAGVETTKALDPASMTSFSTVGDVLGYVVTVTNRGNVTLTDVAVSDPRADVPPVCSPRTLAPGASATCPAIHTVNQADLDLGRVSNVATGSGVLPAGGVISDPSDPVTVPAVQSPALALAKGLAPGSITAYSAVGDVIDYAITVSNTGNVTLSGVAVTDARADSGSISCGASTLAPGASATCTAIHTVTQPDLDAGSVTNTATATGIPPGGSAVGATSAPVIVPASASPSLITAKSTAVTSVTAVGEVVGYAITVTNTGNVTLGGVSVDDPRADVPPVCSPATIAPGGVATCPATHTVTQADLDAGSIGNIATGSATPPGGGTVGNQSAEVTVPVVQTPSIHLAKALAPPSITSFSAVGEVIDYVITATNTGNVTVDALTVVDNRADTGSIVCDTATLAPGASATCTASHTVTQGDLDAGSVVNTASSSATPPSGPPVGATSNDVTVPAVADARLETVKSTPATGYSTVGAILTYSITVANVGNVTIAGIAVTDPMADPGSINCDATQLAPGATATCTATHTVVLADLDGGSVVNTATATGTPPAGPAVIQPSNPVTVAAQPLPSLLTVKSTSTTAFDAVGEALDYAVTVQNTGNVTLSNVGLTDPGADPGTIVCAPTTLAPGATMTCSATHTVTQADLDAGFFANTATGAGTSPSGQTFTAASNEVRVEATKISGIETLKTTTTADFDQVGDVIRYQITVRNAGNVTVSAIAVSDANADPGSISCDATVIAPAATATCVANHTVTQADLDAGEVVNLAGGSGLEPGDLPIADDSNEVRVPAVLTRTLEIVKSSPTVAYGAVDDVIAYVIGVRNTGNVTLSAITVTDPGADPGSVLCDATTIAPTEVVSCVATHTVTQADLDAGSFANVAVAAGRPPIGPEVTARSAEVTVPAIQSPSLTTVKAPVTASYDAAGQVISYLITVTNSGNVTIGGLAVSDPNADTAPTCDVTALAPAATATCTAVHTVTQADIDAGEVLNTATASGAPPSGPRVADASDEIRVPAVQSASIAMAKSSSTAGYATVGDVIRYSITVTNTGNVTMSNVAITDPAADAGSVSCAPTTLVPGETSSCSATHTVTQADLDLGTVVNTATSSADNPTGTPAVAMSNTVTVAAVQSPGLLVGKVLAAGSQPQVATLGEVISYLLTVRNTGNVTLNSVTASDPGADAIPVCDADTLAPAATATCTAAHTVTQADLDAGVVHNTASGAGVPPSGAPITSSSPTISVPVLQSPSITTTKALAAGSITGYSLPGEVIDYVITVANTGNVTLSGVSASDPLADAAPSCATAVLAPGESTTCLASHTVTQADIDRGSVVNIATAGAVPPVGAPVNADSNPVAVAATRSPAILTTKVSDTPDFDAVGDVIGYTVTVANTGNVTVTGVAVSDANADATPVCSPTVLAPGEVATCPATHTVTLADLDRGAVLNVADGSAADPSGDPVTDASDEVAVPAVVLASLLTSKSSPTATYQAVGDVIDYAITVANTGNVTVGGVTVTDPIADPGSIVCTPVDLAPGATAACSATHTVTQADLDAGRVVNTATGAGLAADGSPVSDPSNEMIVGATKLSGIEVLKSTTTTGFDQVGDVIHYDITVRNAGNVTVTDVTVTDPAADQGSISCAPTILAPGAITSCTATHTATQGDLDAGRVVNIASAAANEPGGATVDSSSNEVVVPAVLTRTIETVKTASTVSFSAVGEPVGYLITVRNTGNVTMSGVSVSDANADPGSLVCDTDTVAPGEVVSCTATHTVSQADLDRGEVVNTATAQGTPPIGPSINDPSNEVVVPAVQNAGIMTTKTADTAFYRAVGDVVGYTITVVNTGNVTVDGLTVTDANADPGSIACDLVALAPGVAATCTATHTVTQADLDRGEVLNTASAAATDPAGGPVSGSSEVVRVPAIQSAGLRVAKSSSMVSFSAVGDAVAYVVTVTNIGNVTIDGVAVADPVADPGSVVCAPLAIGPGESSSCSAVHTVTQADLDRGLVANTATGSGAGPNGVTVDALSNEVIVPGVRNPAVVTAKSSSTTDFDAVGDVIVYTITVTNSGNVTVSDIGLSDAKADTGSVACAPSSTLAPGETATCSATHTATQVDLDAGEVVNIASGSGLPPFGARVVGVSDPVAVPAVQAPALDVVKSTSAVEYLSVGTSITYSITVTNTGNVTVSSLGVDDPGADPGSVVCDTSVLAPGATASCAAVHTVVQSDLDAGEIVNVASASAVSPAGQTVDGVSNEVVVPAVALPSVAVAKSSSTVSFDAVGDPIDYSVTILNTGNQTLTEVSASDALADPGSIVCDATVIAPGPIDDVYR